MTEPPAIAELVDEGMLLVGAAVRLAVKNTVIVGLLRDGESWDEPALLESMRRDIRGLVRERLGELTRIESAIDRARGKPGQPRSPDDYRRLDVPILERRREVAEAVTDRLRSLLRDDDLLRTDLFRARDSALVEMQQHSWAASGLLRPEQPPDDRARALRRLRREIAALRPARVVGGSAAGSR